METASINLPKGYRLDKNISRLLNLNAVEKICLLFLFVCFKVWKYPKVWQGFVKCCQVKIVQLSFFVPILYCVHGRSCLELALSLSYIKPFLLFR